MRWAVKPGTLLRTRNGEYLSIPSFWFNVLASFALGVALLCCFTLIILVMRYSQRMAVMNWVWPVTALYFGPVAIYAYWRLGRPLSKPSRQQQGQRHSPHIEGNELEQ